MPACMHAKMVNVLCIIKLLFSLQLQHKSSQPSHLLPTLSDVHLSATARAAAERPRRDFGPHVGNYPPGPCEDGRGDHPASMSAHLTPIPPLASCPPADRRFGESRPGFNKQNNRTTAAGGGWDCVLCTCWLGPPLEPRQLPVPHSAGTMAIPPCRLLATLLLLLGGTPPGARAACLSWYTDATCQTHLDAISNPHDCTLRTDGGCYDEPELGHTSIRFDCGVLDGYNGGIATLFDSPKCKVRPNHRSAPVRSLHTPHPFPLSWTITLEWVVLRFCSGDQSWRILPTQKICCFWYVVSL